MRRQPASPPSRERDPYFDLPPIAPDPRPYDPEDFQRLVANPFLGLLGLMVLVAFMTGLRLLEPRLAAWMILVAVALAGLFLVRVLSWFQFHCLDCGATGRLLDWKEHACPRVLERRRQGRRRWLRWPSPPAQLVIWLLLLAGVAMWAGDHSRFPTARHPGPHPTSQQGAAIGERLHPHHPHGSRR